MTAPTTKDRALRALGAESRSVRRTISPYVDFELLGSGRRLVNIAERYTDLLIGVAGSVLVEGPTRTLSLHGLFVIDNWMLDEQRQSQLAVSTSSPLALARVSWQYRFVVFESLPGLGQLSSSTRDLVLDSGSGWPRSYSAAVQTA